MRCLLNHEVVRRYLYLVEFLGGNVCHDARYIEGLGSQGGAGKGPEAVYSEIYDLDSNREEGIFYEEFMKLGLTNLNPQSRAKTLPFKAYLRATQKKRVTSQNFNSLEIAMILKKVLMIEKREAKGGLSGRREVQNDSTSAMDFVQNVFMNTFLT